MIGGRLRAISSTVAPMGGRIFSTAGSDGIGRGREYRAAPEQSGAALCMCLVLDGQ